MLRPISQPLPRARSRLPPGPRSPLRILSAGGLSVSSRLLPSPPTLVVCQASTPEVRLAGTPPGNLPLGSGLQVASRKDELRGRIAERLHCIFPGHDCMD